MRSSFILPALLIAGLIAVALSLGGCIGPPLRAIRHHGARSRDATAQVRADIDRVPYDDAKLRADLEAAHEPRQRMGQLVEEILLDSPLKLSDQGRKVIGDFRLGAANSPG